MIRMMRWFAIAWLFQGCITLSNQPIVAVPGSYQRSFSDCYPGDGAANVVFLRDGAIFGSGDAEWIANQGEFTLEMSDPLGRNLLRLNHNQGYFVVTGLLARKIPRLTMRKDGFLEVGGQWLALRVSELPCIFAGKLPRNWLQAVRLAEQNQIVVADPKRTINIVFDRSEQSHEPGFCATLIWGGFAWYHHQLRWCQQGPKLREGLITSDQDISLRIVQNWEED